MEETYRNNYDSIIQDSLSWANDPDVSTSNVFDNFFRPNIEQRAEFGQQVALQQMQNNWNSAPNQMELMKKAGINANVAASGIAGAGNAPSAGSPNSAVGAGAAGLGSAAQAAGAVNEAVNAGVNAYEKFSLTFAEKDRKKAEVANLLASAFHNKWLGRAVAEMLPLQKENERADTWLKLANFDKAREEKKLINKRISEAQAHIDEMKKQADLFDAQANVAKAEEFRIEAQTAQIGLQNDKLQWDKDFREKWHFDNTKPIDNAMIEAMAFEDGDALGAVNSIGQSIETISKSERKGFNAAEIEDGYNKALASIKADKDLQALYAPYLAMIETNKQAIIDLIKMFTESPDNIQGIIGKLINLIAQIGLAGQIESGPVNTAKRPVIGDPFRTE